MPTDFIKKQELNFTEEDVIDATLGAIIELLNNIGDVEAKHIKSYVKGIVMLMDLVTDDETEIEFSNEEVKDPDFKSFLDNLDGCGVIKVGIKDHTSNPLEDLFKVMVLKAILDDDQDEDDDDE